MLRAQYLFSILSPICGTSRLPRGEPTKSSHTPCLRWSFGRILPSCLSSALRRGRGPGTGTVPDAPSRGFPQPAGPRGHTRPCHVRANLKKLAAWCLGCLQSPAVHSAHSVAPGHSTKYRHCTTELAGRDPDSESDAPTTQPRTEPPYFGSIMRVLASFHEAARWSVVDDQCHEALQAQTRLGAPL